MGPIYIREALHHKSLDACHIDEGQQEEQQLRQLMPDKLSVQVFKIQCFGHAGSLVNQPRLQQSLQKSPAKAFICLPQLQCLHVV